MSAAIKVWDTYRNRETTFREFAEAEGCKRMAVYLYYRRHGSLDGFRRRPSNGNGIIPHTYTYKGQHIRIQDAVERFGVRYARMIEFRRLGITDVEKMVELINKRKEANKVLHRTDDGRMMTAAEFAREKGVTSNTVHMYLRNHKGSLAGFDSRLVSRITVDYPIIDPKTGMETSLYKVAKECGCTVRTVRRYFRRHNTVDGLKEHLRGKNGHSIKVEYNGEKKRFIDWAAFFGVNDNSVRKYYNRHGTLEGFENRKKSRGRKAQLVEFRGEKHTLVEWANRLGSYYALVRLYYLSKGTLEGFEERKRNKRRRQ